VNPETFLRSQEPPRREPKRAACPRTCATVAESQMIVEVGMTDVIDHDQTSSRHSVEAIALD
jgi:hypothetical protein